MSTDKLRIFLNQTVDLEFTIVGHSSVVIDLTLGGTFVLNLRSPIGNTLSVTPIFVTDGTDGKVHYKTAITDLDIPGIWHAQIVYTDIAGDVYPANTVAFKVIPRG